MLTFRPHGTTTDLEVLSSPLRRVRDSCERLGVDQWITDALLTCERQLQVQVPLRRDDGRIESYPAWRTQHNLARGPGKGGVRVHPSVDAGQVVDLAVTMTLKAAALDLPFGGAKGGIRCDPRGLSAAELERLMRRYAEEIQPLIGPDTDIPAPDVNTDARCMGWMLDALQRADRGRRDGSWVTGKPPSLGGNADHGQATARGLSVVTERVMDYLDRSIQGSRIVLQGFGKVGGELAKMLCERGALVVAVEDADGAVADSDGLPVAELLQHTRLTGSVAGFPSADPVASGEIWTIESDVLIPAALGDVVDGSVAARVAAQVVIEAANHPVTETGDRVLDARGIVVVPDVLANAGGVIDSYHEWVQARQGVRWTQVEHASRLVERMHAAVDDVLVGSAAVPGTTLRQRATDVAVMRVAGAVEHLGV